MESFFVQMDYGFIFHKKCLPDLYTFPEILLPTAKYKVRFFVFSRFIFFCFSNRPRRGKKKA